MAPIASRPVPQLDAGKAFFGDMGFAVDHLGPLWHLLKAAQLVMSDLDRIASEQGLSYADFQLLGALMMAAPDPVRAATLAAALNVSNPVLSLRSARLAAMGLIERVQQGSDRRTRPMRLPPEGRARTEIVARELERRGAFVRHLAQLDKADRATLERVLRDIHERMDRDYLPSPRSAGDRRCETLTQDRPTKRNRVAKPRTID